MSTEDADSDLIRHHEDFFWRRLNEYENCRERGSQPTLALDPNDAPPQDPIGQQLDRGSRAVAESMLARWNGDEQGLLNSCRVLMELTEYLEGRPEYQITLIRALEVTGTAYARQGYFTRRREDLQQGIRLQKRAVSLLSAREGDRSLELAGAWRDLGDTQIGLLIFVLDEETRLEEEARSSLRRAVDIYSANKSRKSGVRARVVRELAACNSSLAVADAVLALRMGAIERDHAQPEIDEHTLLAEAEKAWKASWNAYEKVRGEGRPAEVPFRWTRTCSNLAFAASYLFELTSEQHWFDRSKVAFEIVETTYRSETHPHRLAVNLEGHGDLLLANALRAKRSVSAPNRERIQEKYRAALRLYSRENKSDRAQECSDTIRDLDAPRLPDGYRILNTRHDVSMCRIVLLKATAASSERFFWAQSALTELATMIQRELERAQSDVPRTLEQKRQLVNMVNRGMDFGIAFETAQDGERLTGLFLQKGKTLTWRAAKRTYRGFRNHVVRAHLPPSSHRGPRDYT